MILGDRGYVFLLVLTLALICLSLPLLGVKLAGLPVHQFLRFPPMAYPINYPRFHPGAFVGFVGLVFLFCFLWFKGYRPGRGINAPQSVSHLYAFPWWGWCGVLLGIIFWILAWTRMAWFATYQPYIFIPQWLLLIVVMNALSQWRSGRCPILDDPSFFLRLFPASAALWWVFEYFNRFVNNWVYENASYARNPLEYILFATVAFSTVIPGVYSTKRFLETFPGLGRFFARGPAVSLPENRAFYVIALLAVSVALVFLSWHPEILYPLLWVGPLVVWLSLCGLMGISTWLGGIRSGDWSVILEWSLAALICGVFWEMWNYYSISKWTYQVPYLEAFKIFEMPIAGYTGYLAFGLECAMAVEIVRGLSGSRP